MCRRTRLSARCNASDVTPTPPLAPMRVTTRPSPALSSLTCRRAIMCATALDTRSGSNGLVRYSEHPERMAAMMVSARGVAGGREQAHGVVAVVAQVLGDPAACLHPFVEVNYADSVLEVLQQAHDFARDTIRRSTLSTRCAPAVCDTITSSACARRIHADAQHTDPQFGGFRFLMVSWLV